MMLWLWLACTAPPAETAAKTEETEVSPDTAGDTEPAEPAVFANPAEATDEDPDEGVFRTTLTAAEATFDIGGWQVDGYAYNGQVPGPTVRIERGDTVEITLFNELDVPTTIHWHGLHVPYDMDGITWSQDPVMPGESYVYTFTVDQVGTYWYHPHFDTENQVNLGLYGAFVVEDPDAPTPDAEWLMVLDDWEPPGDTAANGETTAGEHTEHDHREWTWTVNGQTDVLAELPAASVVHARFINTSNAGYVKLDAEEGLTLLGTDQGWGASIEAVASGEGVVLAPGDRAELEWIVTEGSSALLDQPFSVMGGETWETDTRTVLAITGTGTGTAEGLAWPVTAEAPTVDPGRTDLRYTLQGDSNAGSWMINGETFPDVTVPELAYGDEVVIEVRNLSSTRHPFHLHGHAFEVLSIDGIAPSHRRLEDTLDLGRYETARLLFTANNIGSWMTHCHILPHADGGMMTVIDVVSDP